MRIIRVLLSIVVMLVAEKVTAQDLFSKGTSPDLHLEHNVVAKETWYSLGRLYNLSAKLIATYNKTSLDKPLEIAQVVKIPLNGTNFSQDEKKAQDEVLLPVYHIVGEKEWMYRIGLNHNKVPVEMLEKWNGMKSAEIKTGMKLIVGHLKVRNTSLLASANNSKSIPAPVVETVKQTAPVVREEQNTSSTIHRTNENSSSVPAVNTIPASSGAGKSGGYFKSVYGGKGKSTSGIAGVFKSTSGWNDNKYYALLSNVPVGTIIKVTFPQTGNAIYAKVLGELPDMKESAGLILRISDAAANELGATSNKFSVDIHY